MAALTNGSDGVAAALRTVYAGWRTVRAPGFTARAAGFAVRAAGFTVRAVGFSACAAGFTARAELCTSSSANWLRRLFRFSSLFSLAAGAVGAVGNAQRFPSPVGRRGFHRGFPQDVSFHSPVLLRHLAQQLFFVFAQQIHVQVPRRFDPVLVSLDCQRTNQP